MDLYIPPKPAIIRATEMPRSPADARGIRTDPPYALGLGGSFAAHLMNGARPHGNDANMLLLLHCDGADGSSTFTDSSASARTITRVGTAQVDTAQSVFGGASCLLDGNSDYLSVPDSTDWAFGTGNFTVDFRARWNALPTDGNLQTFWGQCPASFAAWSYMAVSNTAGAYSVFYSHAPSASTPDIDCGAVTAVSTGVWYHFALVRNGTNFRIYKDGAMFAESTHAQSVTDIANALFIGRLQTGADRYFDGWIDEFSISNVARWTHNFIPPTSAYS